MTIFDCVKTRREEKKKKLETQEIAKKTGPKFYFNRGSKNLTNSPIFEKKKGVENQKKRNK